MALSGGRASAVETFDFYRFRFAFRALDPVLFPPGQSGNLIRGALASILREMAPAELCSLLFGDGTPEPRPFVLRCAHLDGSAPQPGESFFLDVHIFELRRPLLASFQAVFQRFARDGIGPGRGRVELTGVLQLDPDDVPMKGDAPCSVSLVPDRSRAPLQLTLRFVTPTELKTRGQVTDRPEFAVLFARLFDRIRALSSRYGSGAPDADRRALLERAASVLLTRCDLTGEYASRKSTRSGQTHPLGGFSGEAVYEGDLAEFLPWLRAMRWVGVGRQTVWGKGDVRLIETDAGTPLLTRATPR